MKIGDFIRKLREEKKWLQSDLSKKSGIKQTNISFIEKYSRMPNFDVACQICEALGITPNTMWKNIRDDILKIPLVKEKASGLSGEDGRRLGEGESI